MAGVREQSGWCRGTRVLATVLATMLCGICVAQVKYVEVPVQVELADVDAAAALLLMARGFGLALEVSPQLQQRISLSGTFPTGEEVLREMAVRAGAVFERRGEVRVVTAPQARTPLDRLASPAVPRRDHCPYRVTAEPVQNEPVHKCQALEFFPLHALLPRGFVRVKHKSAAIVESPDGVLTTVHVGDYLGQDFGKTQAISPDGIRLQEVVSTAGGDFELATRTLAFGVHPAPTASSMEDHVEEGSPQHAHDAALANVLALAELLIEHAERCMREVPEQATWVQAALFEWQRKNARALSDLERQFAAYLERKSWRVGENASVLGARYRAEISEAVTKALQGPEGPSEARMQRVCFTLPFTLRDRDRDLETRYATQLDLLRTCDTRSTCANLR